MRNLKIHFSLSAAMLGIGICLSACSSHSQAPKSSASDSSNVLVTSLPQELNPEGKLALLAQGKNLYLQGNQAHGLSNCVACHGANGEGQAASSFPRIAGQSQLYLIKTLKNFQEGSRVNAVMSAVAKQMTDEDIRMVSAFLAQAPLPPYPHFSALSAPVLKRAEKLADVGDAKLNLQSCSNCHGPSGVGEMPAIPYLAGQYPNYLEAQLNAWKKGERKTSPEHMGYIASKLNPKDVKALSLYYANAREPRIRNHAPLHEISPSHSTQ